MIYFSDEFYLNRLLTCITGEVGGVVGVTPEGMGHHILVSVKMTFIFAIKN